MTRTRRSGRSDSRCSGGEGAFSPSEPTGPVSAAQSGPTADLLSMGGHETPRKIGKPYRWLAVVVCAGVLVIVGAHWWGDDPGPAMKRSLASLETPPGFTPAEPPSVAGDRPALSGIKPSYVARYGSRSWTPPPQVGQPCVTVVELAKAWRPQGLRVPNTRTNSTSGTPNEDCSVHGYLNGFKVEIRLVTVADDFTDPYLAVQVS